MEQRQSRDDNHGALQPLRVVFLPQGSRGCASGSASGISCLVSSSWKGAVNPPSALRSSGVPREQPALGTGAGSSGTETLPGLVYGSSCLGRGCRARSVTFCIFLFPPSVPEAGQRRKGMLFPRKSRCLGIFSTALLTRRHLCWPQLPDLSSSHLLPFNPARGERSEPPLALLRQPFHLGEEGNLPLPPTSLPLL